jgi:hypothetical protein
MPGLALALMMAAATAAQSSDPGYPVDYEQQIRAHLELQLKDYSSAIIKLERPPRSTMLNVTDRMFGKPVPAYVACYLVNAKNSYGGYVGFRPYAFGFLNGKLVNAWEYRKASRPADVSTISKECEKTDSPPPQ